MSERRATLTLEGPWLHLVGRGAAAKVVARSWCHPSLNAWTHFHWTEKHVLRTEWSHKVRAVAGAAGWPRFGAPSTVRVTTFHATQRTRDPDNAAPKFLLDALRDAGVIVGDDSARLRLVLEPPLVDRARPRTVVQIEGPEGPEWGRPPARGKAFARRRQAAYGPALSGGRTPQRPR